MKNLISLLIILCMFFSCMDREVQLPHTTNNDITEVLDVSPIYIFYDETKPDSVDFNRRNMISTTNWLVNIDKRLTLKQVLPHLQYLQEKRHGDGMHKNKNAKNYFTCFNPETENLSFIEFTDNNFKHDTIFIFKHPKITINSEDNPEVSKPSFERLFFRKDLSFDLMQNHHPPDFLNSILTNFSKEFTNQKIKLNFHENLTFQDYITVKTILLELENENIIISKEEFIYK